MGEPDLTGKALSNVATEHTYKIRATFAASSVPSYRSKDATIAKVTTTTFLVTFPKLYVEVVGFNYAWFAATGVAPLACKIIANNLATAGTLTLETEATNTAGTPTAPAVGDVLYLELSVSSDVLNNRYIGP